VSQYSEIVEQQRLLIAAEKWALVVKSLHVHSMNSMWYDDRPQDTDGKSVMDIEYNGGWIERWQDDEHIHTFGRKMSREELIDAYGRVETDRREV
tara:strand:+ start:317 stop:601 length:285 start_codon:yes stop_codon:yes gene_type:complete